MMDRRLAWLPLLALAGTSLSGCVAAAIPVIAGSALAGSRMDGKDAGANPAPAAAAAVVVPAPAPPPPVPVVTMTPPPPPPPVAVSAPPPVTAPAVVATAPAAAATIAVAPAAPPPPVVEPVVTPAPLPPGVPSASDQTGFARFVRYGAATAGAGTSGTAPLSAMLRDPIAIDGQRRQCAAGEQPVALIDLDPKGGVFAPPADPAAQTGLALGLAVLREAGVVIAWLSDLSVNESGTLRAALERSGLDPRGEDIISLRRDTDDRKQQRKDNLAGITCIIAIAGDERPDFDERFKYLRSPEAGAELEPLIGDGWFLIEPVFPEQGQAGQ